MNLVKCENGHFYDKEKYHSCPHCNAGDITIFSGSETNHSKLKRTTKLERIYKNIVDWFIQTVWLSSIPLFFLFIVHSIFQLGSVTLERFISEISSFVLVLSSSIAVELAKEKYKRIREVVFPAYMFLLMVFLMFYGATIISFEFDLELRDEVLNNIILVFITIGILDFLVRLLLQIYGGIHED